MTDRAGARREGMTTAEIGSANFAAARAERARVAGRRNAELAADALARIGERSTPLDRSVAEARIASPDASWSEIAAKCGITTGAAYNAFRHLLRTAPKTLVAPAYGSCIACGRFFRLSRHGMMQFHTWRPRYATCPGACLPPAGMRKEVAVVFAVLAGEAA